jgi:hypothetical protein
VSVICRSACGTCAECLAALAEAQWLDTVLASLSDEDCASLLRREDKRDEVDYRCLGVAGGGTWSRKKRARVDTHPTQRKITWQVEDGR